MEASKTASSRGGGAAHRRYISPKVSGVLGNVLFAVFTTKVPLSLTSLYPLNLASAWKHIKVVKRCRNESNLFEDKAMKQLFRSCMPIHTT